MEAKHTPGPWDIDEGTGHIIPASGAGGGVADAWGDNLAQRDANARLIAAAPELLEALMALSDRLSATEYMGIRPTEQLQQARAAIDAATK